MIRKHCLKPSLHADAQPLPIEKGKTSVILVADPIL